MAKLPGFSIRTKLLLASLTLLIVPWLGYHYIQNLESYLRGEQEQRLLNRAALLAVVMSEHVPQFSSGDETTTGGAPLASHLYIRPLRYAIQLDGYLDDWQYYPDRVRTFVHPDNPQDLKISYRLGTYHNYLYLVLEIEDDELIYRQPNSLRLDRSDHLRIGLLNKAGEFSRYWISTPSPGWVNAYRIPERKSAMAPQPEFRIKGEWQETARGYTIEIRLPTSMIGHKFAFAFADVDDRDKRAIETLAGTGETGTAAQLSTIVIPIPAMTSLLKRLQTPGERIWVVDGNYRVLALAGDIRGNENASSYQQGQPANEPPLLSRMMRVLLRLALQQSLNEFNDDLAAASRLENATVSSALQGQGVAHWRPTENPQVSILTVAQPIYRDEKVVGAVTIEETSNSILILQNRALEILISLSVVAFFLTVVVLLAFATRLSLRVRKLRNETDHAIAADGSVQGSITPSAAGDELGDLSRSFAAMVERLGHYNRYLETMAGKLAHELRTPVSVVRSSLDNLYPEQSADDARRYQQRAREGIDRLSSILSRMSEATRLEQTLQQEQLSRFDLARVVKGCIEGYRLVHPQRCFELHLPPHPLMLNGSADLIAQMFDKLISNACDFSPPDQPILINLVRQRHQAQLTISNSGPTLPREMQGSLFDSMVSLRPEKSGEPHLGLGLYIARLIVEFHGGAIRARNRADRSGVEFQVSLPLEGR